MSEKQQTMVNQLATQEIRKIWDTDGNIIILH